MAEARVLALLVTAFVCTACGSNSPRTDEGASATPVDEAEAPMQAADAEASAEPQSAAQPAPTSGSATAAAAAIHWPRHLQPIDEREAAIARAMQRDFSKYDTDRSGGLSSAEFAKLEEDVLGAQAEAAQVRDAQSVPLQRNIVTSHAGRAAPRQPAPAAQDTDAGAAEEEEESPRQSHSRPRAEYARPMD